MHQRLGGRMLGALLGTAAGLSTAPLRSALKVAASLPAVARWQWSFGPTHGGASDRPVRWPSLVLGGCLAYALLGGLVATGWFALRDRMLGVASRAHPAAWATTVAVGGVRAHWWALS